MARGVSWLSRLLLLLLLSGCAAKASLGEPTRTSQHRFAMSQDFPDTGTTKGRSTHFPFVGAASIVAASSTTQKTRIGWVYRIEGHLDGQPVQYVGSAADLKKRLTSKHQWTRLLQQNGTKVFAMEVLAELDVQASNRRTLMSARNEALRAAEQRALEQVKEQVERANQGRTPGAKETKILNEINASTDAAAWEARHKVVTSRRWQLFERRATGFTTKAVAVLTLLDAYLMYHNVKMSRYVMAPYVLEDEQGLFILEKSESLLSSRYFKMYMSDGAKGQRVEIPLAEFRSLKAEAEALWGTTDWRGDLVPGLLNRELMIIQDQDAVQQAY